MLNIYMSFLPGSAITMELACKPDCGQAVGCSCGLSMRELRWSSDMRYFALALKPAGKVR